MSNLTSTLTLQLVDDGLKAKARADAEAIKKLGASAADIKKLAATNPQIAKTVQHLDALAARGAKLDAFRAGARHLKELGQGMRLARADVAATAAALAKAEGKGVKAAERALKAALRRNEAATDAWREQARAHRDLRRELPASGVGLGGRGANGGRGLAIGEAMRTVATQAEQANAHLREQVRLVAQAGQAAQGAVTRTAAVQRRAGPTLLGGMGAAGRAQLGDIEARRRVASGMGRPHRERAAAAAAEDADAEAARAGRRQEAREARKTIAGAGLLYAGHKAAEMKREVLEVYKEVDDLSRYQAAVADLSPEERRSRTKQAMHIGAESRFNDIQVLHAQLDLAQRGVKKQFIEPFVQELVNYGQAMNSDLGDSAKTLEGIIFSTNQDVENPDTAMKVMRRQVDLAVKMSKLGGLNNEDVAQAFKFGGASGSGAGLSNETMATTFALLRRSGYSGAEAGVAQRAIAAKLVSPTQKGLGALDAMGVRWEDFTKLKRGGSADLADNAMQRRFGTKLTAAQKAKFQDVFANEEIFGDQGKFITAATGIVSGSFNKVAKGKNKGKLKAQDAAKIAKTFSDLRRMMIESVDAEGLWDAILAANPTLAQANAWGTDKHGGKIQALARKYHDFKDYQGKLQNTAEGTAKAIGDQRNAGYAGAATRFEGAKKNLYSGVGQALDGGGEGNGGFLTRITSAAATAVQSLAELPAPILATGAAAAYAGGKLATLSGGALVSGLAQGLGAGSVLAIASGKGGAVAAAAGAAAAAAAPVAATAAVGALLISADKSKGIVHGGKNVDTRLDYGDELPGLGGGGMGRANRSPSLPPGSAQPASRAAEGVKSLIDAKPRKRSDTGPILGDGLNTGVPGANAGAVDAATAALGRYRAELATVKAELAGQADLGLPGLGGGLEKRKAELESLISDTKAKLTSLGSETIAPKFDASGAQAFGVTVDGVKTKAQEAGALTISIPVSAPNAGAVISQLTQIIALAGQANAAVAGVNANAGRLQARSGRSFSDGVTPGRGAE